MFCNAIEQNFSLNYKIFSFLSVKKILKLLNINFIFLKRFLTDKKIALCISHILHIYKVSIKSKFSGKLNFFSIWSINIFNYIYFFLINLEYNSVHYLSFLYISFKKIYNL